MTVVKKKWKNDTLDSLFIELIFLDDKRKHPPKFCQKCRMVIYNVLKKGITHNMKNVPEWPDECKGGSCFVCIRNQASTVRKGRRHKLKICGRPALGANVWTRGLTEEIAESCMNFTVPFTNKLRENNLNIIELCICKLCKKLSDKPVMLNCQFILFVLSGKIIWRQTIYFMSSVWINKHAIKCKSKQKQRRTAKIALWQQV